MAAFLCALLLMLIFLESASHFCGQTQRYWKFVFLLAVDDHDLSFFCY
ncbi:hypothetical protein CFter6_1308 [Collimonas fungivorans]|uniref:Uncharacterized protein n=1 Tax=Collimonas fungivorans TaxID=158899 RepID=A0A127P867_9BURK|nr:hypothetical protein CFter6_1308 [Collimonas fungivorans]